MVPRRASTAVLLGLVISLMLHASILVPGLMQVMRGEVQPVHMLRANFDSDDFVTTAQPDQVELGLDESTASTMTWIGFDDYQEHMAAVAEVEQAAFQTTPTGSEAAQASPSDAPPETPQDATEQRTPPESPPAPEPTEDPSTSPDPLDELEAWFDAEEGEGPALGEPTAPDARSQALEDILERLQQMIENPVETQQPAPAPKPEQPAPPEPRQPQQAPQPAGQPGVQSDQESDATSTVEVTMEQMTLGRPLAAHGLQLKPRRPEFTTLTLLTAVPANPLAELRFRRDGKPGQVRLVESSGDPRIDEAVLNSLYRWRAAGKQLRELDGKETIPVRIRIMLR